MKRILLVDWFYRFVGKGAVFFFFLSILSLFLYLLGNFQEFLDETQFFLLRVLQLSLILEVLFCLLFIVLLITMAEQRRRILKLTAGILSAFFSYLLLLAFKFLSTWFQA